MTRRSVRQLKYSFHREFKNFLSLFNFSVTIIQEAPRSWIWFEVVQCGQGKKMHLCGAEWLISVRIMKLILWILLSDINNYAFVKELFFASLLVWGFLLRKKKFIWEIITHGSGVGTRGSLRSFPTHPFCDSISQVTFIIWDVSLPYLSYRLVKQQCDLQKSPLLGILGN